MQQIYLILVAFNIPMVTVFAGDGLGLDPHLPNSSTAPPTMNPLPSKARSKADYIFVHTDSHQEFMDLLLQKRQELEQLITSKGNNPRPPKKSKGDV